MDLSKIGRNEQALAVIGLLAFIDSFLAWWSASYSGPDGLGAVYSGSVSENAWNVGFLGWFSALLLLAVGVVAVLPAFGQEIKLRGGFATLGGAAVLATLLILIRWFSYPGDSGDGWHYGASYGTYIAAVLGIAAVVFSYLGFTASGGKLNNLGAAFNGGQGAVPQQGYPQQGYVPPAEGYVPPPGFPPPGEQPQQWQPPQQ